MNARRALFAPALACFLILSSIPLVAQFTSAIEGTVSDPSGAALPNATVTLRNEDTGATQATTTSAAGYYRFPRWRPPPHLPHQSKALEAS